MHMAGSESIFTAKIIVKHINSVLPIHPLLRKVGAIHLFIRNRNRTIGSNPGHFANGHFAKNVQNGHFANFYFSPIR